MTFNFGEIFSRAWQITWKYKVLWIFGILAGCSRSGTYLNSNSEEFGPSGIIDILTELLAQISRWTQMMEENIVVFIIILAVAFLIIWLVMTGLSAFGKIGLIHGTARANKGLEKMIFGQLWIEGRPYFWRVFGLSLLIGLPALIITATLLTGLFLYFAAGIAYDGGNSAYLNRLFFTVLGGFCLFIPMKFIVDMIVRQTYTAIVLEDIHVLPAISRGWNVFRKNLGTLIVLTILFAVIGLVVGAMIAIPTAILSVPFSIVFNIVEGQRTLMLVLLGLYLGVFVPIMLVLNGILNSFRDVAWTLTYLQLTRSAGLTQSELQEATL